jgi:two-component system NarL family response regulator
VFPSRVLPIVSLHLYLESWERRLGDGRRPIRIVLADEHALFREAVRVVLEAERDLHVVGDVSDGSKAAAEARRTMPDCVLLDAALAGRGATSATRRIVQDVPNCRVLVLAGEEDQDALIEALEAGASGYLTKESPLEALIDAVRAVHRGETLVPPRMLGGLVSGLIRRRENQEEALRKMSRLMRREREVLALLARGAGNVAIAESLVISPETARTHIQNVIAKLGVHSRLEAAMFVSQNRLLDELAAVEAS